MSQSGPDALAEIISAWDRLRVDAEFVVDREQVRRWAESTDLEALGALSSLLFHPDDSRRIVPNLTLDEYLELELPYLERCLREDPAGRWADSRWQAGGMLANWIKNVWREERFRYAVDVFARWLERLYKSSENISLRTCIVQATLEHVFEVPEIAERFDSWRTDPVLKDAYNEAKSWKEGLDSLGIEPVKSR